MRSKNEVQSMQYRLYKVRLLHTMSFSLERWSKIKPLAMTLKGGENRAAIFSGHLWLVDAGPYLFPFDDENIDVLNQNEQVLRLPYPLWIHVPVIGDAFKSQTVARTMPVHEWMNNPLLQLAYSGDSST